MLAKANFLGCYMNDEVPITYRPREGVVRERMWEDGKRVSVAAGLRTAGAGGFPGGRSAAGPGQRGAAP